MAWTEERVELLKKLWVDGKSASEIAMRIGGNVSRNAVIGKVHRLGLSGRIQPCRNRVLSKRPKSPRVKHPQKQGHQRRVYGMSQIGNPALRNLYQGDVEPYTPPTEELVIPLAERKTVQTLEDNSCRWGIGDPRDADFHFCGKDKVTGLPYCEHHSRRAFQPPQRVKPPEFYGGPSQLARTLEPEEPSNVVRFPEKVVPA